jgi:hypothetical protein
MQPRDRKTEGGPPPEGPGAARSPAPARAWPDGATDRELLDVAVEMLVTQNRAHAARLEAISDFHARRVAEVRARDAGEPGPWDDQPGFFCLTPLQAAKVEFGPLLGISEMWLQMDLDVTDNLRRWLPAVWRRCRQGRLDLARAFAIQAQLSNLTSDKDRTAYAEKVDAWLERNDRPESPLLVLPREALQRAVRRICRQFPQKSDEESFGEAFRKRRVSMRPGDTGMATITGSAALHDAIRADQRLTLIARKRRETEGETRSLDQLRADTLIDLLMGRVTVGADNGELQDDCVAGSRCGEHEGGPADAPCADPASTIAWHDVGAFARPVVNVTVPITALIGLDDEEASIGGVPIPAELARIIAADPRAAWYRMLTDPAGGFVELSTEEYSPTGAIWRWVVARDVSCVFPGCVRPAAVVHLDHRLPWPQGTTGVSNLQPLCERHHKVKHSYGFRVVREPDGSYTWTSRFGSVSHTPAPEYPQAVWDDLLDQVTGASGRREEVLFEAEPAGAAGAAGAVEPAGSVANRDDDFDAHRFIDQCCWPPEEEGPPVEDPDGVFEAAFREWFDQEVVPAL